MKTFNKELKQHWINVMQGHQDADRLIQGEWWNDERQTGCFFGCAMQAESNALEEAIKAMQLPSWLIYLAEKVFERLPKKEALVFPVQLLQAVPTDTDISEVKHRIAVKRLEPLIKESNGDEVNDVIKQVVKYHKNPERTEYERLAANLAVSSAVESAEYSVEYSVESAVDSAKYSITYPAAYSAAYSAARSAHSAARSAARSAAWIRERDNLLKALQEFKA